jgi:hypothetical protein
MKRNLTLAMVALLSSACAESGDTKPTMDTPGTGGSAAPATCELAQQTCACPDGSMSGVQLCDANTGGLLPCTCSGFSPNQMPDPNMVAGDAGNTNEVTRVCAELEGVAECDARSFASEEIPASVLFVVDRSGSMACNPPPVQTVEQCNETPIAVNPSMPSRWQITVEALKESLAGLQGTNAAAGLTFFSVDNACGVNSTPNVGVHPVEKPQLDAMSLALDAIGPRGGTPIVGSVVLAYAHLHQEAMAPGNRYVVLLTDGEESCGFGGEEEDKADLAEARKHLLEVEVQKALEANIRTFVIGAPGSEGARGFLSELASAGGTSRTPGCVHGDAASATGDCHYDLTTSDDFAQVLHDALGDISGQTLGCEFPTPNGISERINVQYTATGNQTPTCLALDEQPCESADGFQFAKHPDGTKDLSKVILCGPACDRIKNDPGATVDVILGCAPLVVD